MMKEKQEEREEVVCACDLLFVGVMQLRRAILESSEPCITTLQVTP